MMNIMSKFDKYMETQQKTMEKSLQIQEARHQEQVRLRQERGPVESNFPIFEASTNFDDWEDKVLTILSKPQWSKLYDSTNHDIVPNQAQDPLLPSHFFTYISLSLKNNSFFLIDWFTTYYYEQLFL